MYTAKTLKVPVCSLCNVEASVWTCDLDPKTQTPNEPHLKPNNDWIVMRGNIFICPCCADSLRDRFMQESNPKDKSFVSGAFTTVEDNGVVGLVEKTEEYWVTRNGHRVIARMPLPAIGHLVSVPPSPSDKRHTLRWDDKYNCVEASFSKDPAVLALYDLIERLEQSVKKDQI